MHLHLLRALDQAVARFAADPRCLGMYLHGSIGRGETDAYSDIDVCAVIEDEHYEAVKAEMRRRCEELFGPIVVWLPEGERPSYCNYAFLFEHGEELLLTDFDIIARSLFVEWNRPPDRILWDRTGVLGRVAGSATPAPAAGDGRVLHLIDTYWVYAYLDGKYWRRADLYKLLYVLQTLLQLHFRLLHVLHHGTEGGWWAGDIARLPAEEQRQLRAYFCAATPGAAARSLARGMQRFADAARRVCAARGLSYPADRERAVRQHLRTMGLPSLAP
jgi:predicted nucleotidyltransferase